MFAFPNDEFSRVDILPEYGIAEADGESEFDDVVALAAETLGLPLAIISMIGVADLTMVAVVGMARTAIPRDTAICSHTILSDDLLIVPDTALDDRFRDNPLVVGGRRVAFYAGAPIISGEGVRLGALCVMGYEPHRLDAPHHRFLLRLAHLVSRRLDSRRARLRSQAEVERTLHESEALCRTTLSLAKLVPWKADARGRIVSVGEEWSALTGFVDTASLKFSWINFIHPDDVEAFCGQWRDAIRQGKSFEAEMRVRAAAGDPIWCRIRAAPAHDGSGSISGWYGLIQNIEEEREAQTRLRAMHAQLGHLARLNAMEAMASTLAHELNQPLAAIIQYVRGSQRLLARLDDPDTAPIVGALEEAAAGALRAGGIVRSVRELVGRGEVQRRRECLAALVGDAVRAAFIDADGLGIEHRIEVDSRLPAVLVDGIQIQQVLINLLRNAIQALREAPARLITVSAERLSDEECAVTVRDTGPGIPPDVAARLFAPFNTSKTDGMGIGLSISRTIIEAHHGQISAAPVPGGGTAFCFTLPFG